MMHHNQPSKEPDYLGIMIIAFTLLFFTIFAMNLANPVVADTPDDPLQANIESTWSIDQPPSGQTSKPAVQAPTPTRTDLRLQRVIDTICQKIPAPAADLHITMQHDDIETLKAFTTLDQIDARSLINNPLGQTHVLLEGTDARGDAITRTLRPVVELRLEALFMRRDLRRGDVIQDADVIAESRLVSKWPREVQSDITAVRGLALKRPISADEPLCTEHIEFPRLVRRGEQVNLRCVSGNLVITTTATAMDDGGDGDMIEVRDNATRRRHLARVTDRREVTVHADASALSNAQPAHAEQR